MLARALRRIGFRLPFRGVICPELTKTVYIESDWRARMITRRTLVFTSLPRPGDLSDLFAVDPGTPPEVLFYDSPDAVEVGRRRRDAHTLLIEWMPRQTVTRYALYRHEDTWIAPDTQKKSAVSAQFTCDMKTGAFLVEFITPGQFEDGVAFRAPKWRRFRSERSLMKRALASLHDPKAGKARVDDGGKRATWEFDGPRVGDRFIFVVFHEHGMADWERRVEESSLAGRVRRLLGSAAHVMGR
ncbi:MAG TPA: hypothetical protein VK886_16485 [Vicinamibacterales bacterium]|nr:hypothetical protein [Vicinamibacterales bacterium]